MELEPLVCPHCEQEFSPAEDALEYTCDNCGRWLDLRPQFAYSRGLEAFSDGQDILIAIPPKKRNRGFFEAQEKEATQLYMQAYTAIQQAFQAELAENQRYLAIEMMANMARLFLQKSMISPLEASYWTTLMVELTAQRERKDLSQRFIQPASGGILGILRRWRWRSRVNQLEKALVNLDKKIRVLEGSIDFVDPPRARKPSQFKKALR